MTDTTVLGPVDVTGTTSSVTVIGNRLGGPVSVTDNATSEPPVLSSNTVAGPLACSGNVPAPTDDGTPNTVTGPRTGQCAGL